MRSAGISGVLQTHEGKDREKGEQGGKKWGRQKRRKKEPVM